MRTESSMGPSPSVSATVPLLSPVVSGLWRVDLGIVNAYLVAGEGEMVLVDVGPPGSEDKITAALGLLDLPPEAVGTVIVTHHHSDHAGALAAVLDATGADAWMSAADAAEVRVGNGFRPYRPPRACSTGCWSGR